MSGLPSDAFRSVKRKKWFDLKEYFFGITGSGTDRTASSDNASDSDFELKSKPMVVSIMNQKGGCGKTTTAVNLSAALGDRGYRVLVIDMDPQAHATLGLGIEVQAYRKSVYDLLINPHVQFEDIVCSTRTQGLDVLPSSMRLSEAQTELAQMPRGETALRRRLKAFEGFYDFIFIDCPPTLNLLTLNALVYAKRVLIPVQTHYYALEGMKELFRTIDAVRSKFNPDLEILGILATLFDKRVSIASDMLEALRDFFQNHMFETVICSNVKLIEAPMLREPVISYAPQSSSAEEFQRLATEVVGFVSKKD